MIRLAVSTQYHAMCDAQTSSDNLPTAMYTGNPEYLANLVQWHTPYRTLRSVSANLLSVIQIFI